MKKINKNMIQKIVIVTILVIVVAAILMIAPNYIKDKTGAKMNLIINNNNVTAKLKKDIFINENGTIYISKEDMKNYFDGTIYEDTENKKIITTSETKVAAISETEKKVTINGSNIAIRDTIIRKENTVYLPISELTNVYNIEVTKIDKSNTVTIDSLDRALIKADITKNTSVKYKSKTLSKTVDKVKKGDKVIWISEKDGWVKLRTNNGKIGYIKTKNLTNQATVRQKLEEKKQVEGKINLVWDYYSEYVKAPNREGTTINGINVVSPSFFSLKQGNGIAINDNAARGGKEYIQWAKDNNYKVWAMFSNNSMRETTSQILNSVTLREELIEKIVKLAVDYGVDGINIDFENMNMTDKGVFSRFIIELAPRLRECGIVTSVDVTAPDGSENWSLCYDRKTIAEAADYLVFMAYDQYGISSTTPGTTAGYNWVETNIKKFLGQEDVDKEKIILGMPFYTRLWKTDGTGKSTSAVVNMNKISEKLPQEVEKKWDDELKQYYVTYQDENYQYEMWLEEEESIKAKLSLINQYELAGGAFWEKDRETENIWDIAKEALQ